ncbi:sulfite exporter TauE/SafE family protein [Allomuricauda sp. SCSIO 65647]|uniref:sulfite exporter TauE/SafE family protein n=1 Tax=Allomuricauda sp. SCSIO 65647 TaxID=2908843 RepID=UPI001F3F0A7F|nr:sulfite exporter TauE/SafE family protein [Muricauda sp. SCSIO 65647]UJH68483.1 sulfite exporter TauE/SafE family protein [Muricauda sp. SCSIO 65647]
MMLSAAILGLLGSLHCLGMCGPIAFMLPLDRGNEVKKAVQLSMYHFGRILAYALMGFAFGLVGKGLYLFGVQQKLSILIGAIMILLVLVPGRYFKKYSLAKPIYTFLGSVKSKLGQALKKRTPDTFLTIGFLNGFLPCGLVYMALLGAIALGDAIQGVGYMALFGLGTIPLMTTAVYVGGWLKAPMKAKIQKLIPVFVILIGTLFILRGLGLGIPYVSPKPVHTHMVSAEMECHQP